MQQNLIRKKSPATYVDRISNDECKRFAEESIRAMPADKIASLRSHKHPQVWFHLLHDPEEIAEFYDVTDNDLAAVKISFCEMTPALRVYFEHTRQDLGPNDVVYAIGDVHTLGGDVKMRTCGIVRDFFAEPLAQAQVTP